MSNIPTYEKYSENDELILKNFDWRDYLIANLDLVDSGINMKSLQKNIILKWE